MREGRGYRDRRREAGGRIGAGWMGGTAKPVRCVQIYTDRSQTGRVSRTRVSTMRRRVDTRKGTPFHVLLVGAGAHMLSRVIAWLAGWAHAQLDATTPRERKTSLDLWMTRGKRH